MKRYLKLWYIYSAYTTQIGLQSRFGSFLFFIGKILRFGVFLFFIYILSSAVEEVAGFTFWQLIFIFATFNLIDITSQLLLREVYRFRGYVVSGAVDYFLIRPINPIFRFLFGGADILDIPIFLISLIFIFISFLHLGDINIINVVYYISLVFNAFLIALSFHILILSMGILTTEVDNALWLYRDLTAMGRIPVDLYSQPLRSVITFLIPIGVMMTFPGKALFGMLSIQLFILSFLIGVFCLVTSIFIWKFSLKRYSSASS